MDFNKSYEAQILRRLADAATSDSTVSTEVKERCVSDFGIDANRIKVIGNGIDHGIFGCNQKSKPELRKQYCLPQDRIILLQVGRLSKQKNHMAVLQALVSMGANLKGKLLYLIVGDGTEREMLSKYVTEGDLATCVSFTGFLPRAKLVDMYFLADFFILPSTSEGLPAVFLEAMDAGLPIITFKGLEGIKDIYNPECMELIPDRKVESMVATIVRAAEKKWDRERIQGFNRSRTWEYVCERYRELYDMVSGS